MVTNQSRVGHAIHAQNNDPLAPLREIADLTRQTGADAAIECAKVRKWR